MLAHRGAMLAYLEGKVGHLGAMLAHLGGYVGPSWGYLGPCWGRCCPMLGLCWPILRPMLAHVGPSSAIRSEKWQKMGRAQNTVKRGGFWQYRVVGGRGRGPFLLRRGENCRTARTRPGGPWPDLSAYAQQPARGPTMVAVAAGVGVAVVAGTKSGASVVGGSGVVFCEALVVVVGGWASVGLRRVFARRARVEGRTKGNERGRKESKETSQKEREGGAGSRKGRLQPKPPVYGQYIPMISHYPISSGAVAQSNPNMYTRRVPV